MTWCLQSVARLTAQPIGRTRSGCCLPHQRRFFLELLRLRPPLFFALFLPPFFRGTFAPFARASESPIAIACLRLFTLPPFPPGPLFRVPFFRFFIARLTLLPA